LRVDDPDVDHFIPYPLYPKDLAHNFVLAHPACNRSTSDVLAARSHLEVLDCTHADAPALSALWYPQLVTARLAPTSLLIPASAPISDKLSACLCTDSTQRDAIGRDSASSRNLGVILSLCRRGRNAVLVTGGCGMHRCRNSAIEPWSAQWTTTAP